MGGISTFTPEELDELRIFDAQIDAEEFEKIRPYKRRAAPKAPKDPKTAAARYSRTYREKHREQLRIYSHERYLRKKAEKNGQS